MSADCLYCLNGSGQANGHSCTQCRGSGARGVPIYDERGHWTGRDQYPPALPRPRVLRLVGKRER